MSRQIKGFVTRDDFISPINSEVSPIHEISDISLTYGRVKHQYPVSDDSNFNLWVFDHVNLTELTEPEVNRIVNVVKKFSEFLTTSAILNKQNAIILFLNNYNTLNPEHPLTEFSYNEVISHGLIKSVDYMTFMVDDVICAIWCSDTVFRAFYPEYDVQIVLPVVDFENIVNVTSDFITALNEFDLIEFNNRLEEDTGLYPSTYRRILNIPYRVPNTSVTKACYFGFNIYGLQGNYDHILKLELFAHLTEHLGLDPVTVESLFPTILNINEFFIIPRWDRMAIATQVGQIGINSQITKTYAEPFDSNKYIKIYNDIEYIKSNTYNIPFDFNNILLQITNGFYSISEVKDFRAYYHDLITVTSSHVDFARMSQRTQRFVTLLEYFCNICNSENSTEMFNKILATPEYKFTIIDRGGVMYLSYFYKDHQYYVLPKYEHQRLSLQE